MRESVMHGQLGYATKHDGTREVVEAREPARRMDEPFSDRAGHRANASFGLEATAMGTAVRRVHIGPLSLPEALAGAAGLAAAAASLAGFIPGLYRDRSVVVVQIHGYDVGNLVVVVVLATALVYSSRGSHRGRLVLLGALGCLMYDYVTYAFEIVLNPATILYIAVLGLGGWSFLTGLANLDAEAIENAVDGRIVRRATGVVLIIVGLLFGAIWLSQIGQSVFGGNLPSELAAAGWPMNPVYVLDLGFVVPLALLAGTRLLIHRVGGAFVAIPVLVFIPLLAVSILSMVTAQTIAGQALAMPMVAIFLFLMAINSLLAWLALRTYEPPGPIQTFRLRSRLGLT
jgi:hypothetical protein